MAMKLRFKSVGTRIAVTCCALVIGVALLQGSIIMWRSSGLLRGMSKADLNHVSGGILALCQAQHELLQQKLEGDVALAKDALNRSGTVQTGPVVQVSATDQETKATSTVSLPILTCGGSPLLNNFAMVDRVKQLVGSTCTVFQKFDGGLLRISTNVTTADGKRAVGTFIPRTSPVAEAILAGKPYRGRAKVVDKWYIAAYEPIKGARGEVLGALYVGVPQEAVKSVRDGIMKTAVGKTGYVYVIDSEGNYVISKDGKRDGENILESKDAGGRFFVKDICNKDSAARKAGWIEYPWKNEGDSAARMKVASLAYFEPWDWIIGAGSYADEFTAPISAARQIMIWTLLLAIAVAAVVSLFLGRQISQPMLKTVGMLQELGRGHLDKRLRMKRDDEIGTMAEAMDKFAEDLQSNVVGSMQRIAGGDVAIEVAVEDPEDEISPALQSTVAALQGLIAEVDTLSRAAVEGRLSVRGNADQFRGAYREIIQGLNETLDAFLGPITETSTVLDRVADRDLTSRVDGDYRGDFAKVKVALNGAVEALDQSMQQAALSADQVAAAASQISSGSQQLASGAAEQASSLEEVSSSIEELASMTKQNASNAGAANGLAQEAHSSADKGMQAMQRMSKAIDDIKNSADQTARIVKTIDDIAFQTNLLALNAAVEAARAGDAGKGFAVVAEEVRNLAQRSAEAAKNTADLIEESVRNADGGVQISAEVATTLAEIAEGNRKVNELIAEIAAASNEQSSGIEQIASAVTEMDKLTQQNAANSEESASASEELTAQAEELRAMTATFRLSQGDSRSAAA